MMVGLLKQVLSIQDIAVLFFGDEDAEQLYKDFAAAQSGAARGRQRACTRKVTQRPCVQRR